MPCSKSNPYRSLLILSKMVLQTHTLKHGILTAKITSYAFELTGFYFTPVNSVTKCLLLNPLIEKSSQIIMLSEILESAVYSEIHYRELIKKEDITCFKLALVNMQSSFNISKFTLQSWNAFNKTYIDYVTKTIGQNPAERISQCSGECYAGPIVDIKSYDPFDSSKLYHRHTPILSFEDKNVLAQWSQFFKTINPEITVANDFRMGTVGNVDFPPDTLFGVFLHSILDKGDVAKDPIAVAIPLSFRVPTNYVFTGDTYNNEKILTTWGLNIYDGACWEIALSLLKNNSSLLEELRFKRKTTQFASIISNNVNSKKANQYLSPIIEGKKRTICYPYDPDGFAFRTISNYYTFDKDGIPIQFVKSGKYWPEFRPLTGENAWFYGIAPFITSNKSYPGFISTLFNMVDINGGFYSSPVNSVDKSLDFTIEHNVSMYAALSHIIDHLQKGSVAAIGIDIATAHNMMLGIETMIASLKNNYLFYYGKTIEKTWYNVMQHALFLEPNNELKIVNVTYNNVKLVNDEQVCLSGTDYQWKPEVDTKSHLISVKAHLWLLCSLQPRIVNLIFQDKNAALTMWKNLKYTCGRYSLGVPVTTGHLDKELKGFGYNNAKHSLDPFMAEVISTELTFCAMLVCKILMLYYKDDFNDLNEELIKDLSQMEKYVYKNLLVKNDCDPAGKGISDSEAYFIQASMRSQTGFGSIVNPIPCTAATAWHIFYSKSFNPFTPNGKLLREI